MCVCVCMHTYRCVSVCACGGQKCIQGVFLYPFSTLDFLRLNLELTLLVRLVDPRSACSYPSSGYRCRLPQPASPWAVKIYASSCLPHEDFTHCASLPSAGRGWLDFHITLHSHTERILFFFYWNGRRAQN